MRGQREFLSTHLPIHPSTHPLPFMGTLFGRNPEQLSRPNSAPPGFGFRFLYLRQLFANIVDIPSR